MAPKTPTGETRTRIFEFVKECLQEGRPPTVREVQEAFTFKSVQTAREHLENLVKDGRLVKEKGVSRGYRLAGHGTLPRSQRVPILGQVQAGLLTEAIEDPDGYVDVQNRNPSETFFALRVIGQSMINAGILPGDVVVVRRQSVAQDGDIVVAMVEGEATVKRLRTRGQVALYPENDAFSPIVPTDGQELILLGKVMEVRRYLDGRG